MDVIRSKKQKARKNHSCDLCNKIIEKGTTYHYSFIVDGGDSWEFKCHLGCEYIMNELWSWFDPCEGITDQHFDEYLPSYCKEFVCPHCSNFYKDEWGDDDCKEDKWPAIDCLDKIVNRLEKYSLKSRRKPNQEWIIEWFEVEKK